MVETLAVVTGPSGRHETGCDPVTCDWTVARVRSYLICWEQAAKHREPVEHVLGRTKSSRRVDPWNRAGGLFDPMRATDIKVALEQARAAGFLLAHWNAEKIAAWLCANQHQEPIVTDWPADDETWINRDEAVSLVGESSDWFTRLVRAHGVRSRRLSGLQGAPAVYCLSDIDRLIESRRACRVDRKYS